MMIKTTNKYAPEVRERAVRMVLDHERDHASRWAAVVSIAGKIGCAAQTLHEWVKKTEVDRGVRGGVPSEVAAQLKALERENRARGSALQPQPPQHNRHRDRWRVPGRARTATGLPTLPATSPTI